LAPAFVARGFSGEGDQLSDLIQAGIGHRGFALIDILQPCVSFNRVNTHKWYKDRVAPMEESHDETDLIAALALALGEEEDLIPTGIYYRRQAPSYTDRIDKLKDKPLADHRYRPELLKALLND
jgi:2-oxoglutarate ferredoxin oxidoreductase subunit beta